MIGFTDATILAATKLRTRKIRTVTTIVLSGLLFSGLVASLIVSQGAVHSIHSFSNEGLGSRYIVQASVLPSGSLFQNKSIQDRAVAIYTQTVAAKKAAAKKLGIDYDASSDKSPLVSYGDNNANTYLDFANPAAQQAVTEYQQAHPDAALPELQTVSKHYKPIDYFQSTGLQAKNGNLVTMVNGAENFDPPQQNSGPAPGDIFANAQLVSMPTKLTQPFLLPNTPVKPAPALADAIPLIVPYSAATQLLHLSALPGNATAQQKLDRLKELYAKASSIQLSVCYRNNVSENQIQEAISVAQEIAANKNKKDYQKPSLIYGLPAANSCAQAPVISDTRTKAEKDLDQKQQQFQAEFGQVVVPDQQKLQFRIVGLVADPHNNVPPHSAAGIFQSLVGSSLAGAVVIPQDLYNQLPSKARYQQIIAPSSGVFTSSVTNYVEFPNAETAQRFINEQDCKPQKDGTCQADKPFDLSAFGSSSIALSDLQHKFAKVFTIAGIAVIIVATIIMSGTVGRMLADGRRETAVFRAVGAKRIDIATIYTIYTVLLSLCIVVFAFAVGLLAAHLFDSRLWKSTTLQAQLAFAGSDTNLSFHFFRMNNLVWLVLGAAIATGLISMILPLLRNIRRSPIKDMRDE